MATPGNPFASASTTAAPGNPFGDAKPTAAVQPNVSPGNPFEGGPGGAAAAATSNLSGVATQDTRPKPAQSPAPGNPFSTQSISMPPSNGPSKSQPSRRSGENSQAPPGNPFATSVQAQRPSSPARATLSAAQHKASTVVSSGRSSPALGSPYHASSSRAVVPNRSVLAAATGGTAASSTASSGGSVPPQSARAAERASASHSDSSTHGSSLLKQIKFASRGMRGPMVKLGGFSLGVGALKRPVERFFVLDGPFLRWYTTGADMERAWRQPWAVIPKGQVELAGGAQVSERRSPEGKRQIVLSWPAAAGKEAEALVPPDQQWDAWFEALQATASRLAG